MDSKTKPKLDNILNNTLSVKQAQEYLSHISVEDMDAIVKEGGKREAFEAYKARNKSKQDSVPSFTESEKSILWQRIQASSRNKSGFRQRIFQNLRKAFDTIASFFSTSSNTWRVTFAALLLIALSPSLYQMMQQGEKAYQGKKGDGHIQASIQYSVVGPDNQLLRPERPLTEKDTLAFRIKTKEKGYFSIGVLYNHRADLVISNHYLTESVKDLKEGYELKGNLGQNSLVLLYSALPITAAPQKLKPLIIELYKTDASSVVIDKNEIFLFYEKFEVD